MRRAVFFLFLFVFVTACASPTLPPLTQTSLFIFRLDPPALVQLSETNQIINEIPLSFPKGCGLYNLYPPPRGIFLAVELSCSFGPTVLFLDTETGTLTQAFGEADSSFLAWTYDGTAVYLRVDSTARPRIVRVDVNGDQKQIPITELTYDMASAPDNASSTFTFSRGLGFGSEMWLAKRDGNVVQLLLADKNNYISFARFSPDGKLIVFIKVPDSQTPFTVGELWVMNADGSDPRFMAKADAGHGYPPSWSADGKKVAFVVRENAQDTNADQNSSALVSNIYTVDVDSGELAQLTKLDLAQVEAPAWSPDGNIVVFQVVLNGRMDVQMVNTLTGEARSLISEPACCPAWMRK